MTTSNPTNPTAQTAADTPWTISEEFFLAAVRENISLTVTLTNGHKICGQLQGFDSQYLMMGAPDTELVNREAVVSILPLYSFVWAEESGFTFARGHTAPKSLVNWMTSWLNSR